MKRHRALTYDSITSTLVKLCQKNNIVLVLNDPIIDKDNGCAYGDNEIHMGREYSSNYIMLAIFFHEYGHLLVSKRKVYRRRKMSIFQEESLAWVLAMESQQKYFGKEFTKSQGNFMLDCLRTYSKQHYHFSKGYPKVENEDDEER